MLKYPCLVLDHDDTVVQSEATVNYPYFCKVLDTCRPGIKISLREYTEGCFHMGFTYMCRQYYNFSDEEMDTEYRGWVEHIQDHIPAIFPGIERIIHRQKAEGGLIAVVSQSGSTIISRDYQVHFGIQPDAIYSWDLPPHQRKPNPYPLLDIIKKYGLRPEQLLVVDDMKPALDMARSAGVPVAFAGWGRADYPELCKEMEAGCDFSFYSTEKLYKFLFD